MLAPGPTECVSGGQALTEVASAANVVVRRQRAP